MISISKRAGFTLIELMVVVAMIVIIAAAMMVSANGARERAKVQRATVEVRTISQAILAYENFNDGKLPTMGTSGSGVEIDDKTFGFLMGKNATDGTGAKIPVILQAALSGGGAVLDPWGTPYTVVIAEGKVYNQGVSMLKTGFSIPNINCLSAEERK